MGTGFGRLQTKIGWWFSLSTLGLLGLTMVTSIYCWGVLNINTATGRRCLEVEAVKWFRYPIEQSVKFLLTNLSAVLSVAMQILAFRGKYLVSESLWLFEWCKEGLVWIKRHKIEITIIIVTLQTKKLPDETQLFSCRWENCCHQKSLFEFRPILINMPQVDRQVVTNLKQRLCQFNRYKFEQSTSIGI